MQSWKRHFSEKNKGRPSAALAFQKVSMEVKESQNDRIKNRTAYRAVRIITQSIRPRCRQGAGIFLSVSD